MFIVANYQSRKSNQLMCDNSSLVKVFRHLLVSSAYLFVISITDLGFFFLTFIKVVLIYGGI